MSVDFGFDPSPPTLGGDPSDGILAAIARRQAEQTALRDSSVEAWRAFADHRKLTLIEDTEAGTRKLEGILDDVECSIELVFDDDGWLHTLTTAEVVTAGAATSTDVVVEVHPSPKGILNVLRERLLGPADVTIGDGEFDRRYLIHSNPRDEAKSLLDETVRRMIREWCGNRLEIIKYDCGVAYVQSWGVEVDSAALDRALAIAVRLAARRRLSGHAYR